MALCGLTGSLLVFRAPLDRMVHRDLFAPSPAAARVPLDEVVERAVLAAGRPVTRLRLAGNGHPVHEAWTGGEGGDRVWVDPGTGAVRGLRSPEGTVGGFLHEAHRRLLAGRPGEVLVGVGGLAIAVLVISGLVLAFPGRGHLRRACRIAWRPGGRRRHLDLHRVIGLWTAPLLFFSALSGAYFIFHAPVDLIVRRFDPPAPGPEMPIRPEGPRRSLDHLLEQAQARFPQAAPTLIAWPRGSEGPVQVRLRQPGEPHPNGRSFVSLDPHHGSVLTVSDPGTTPWLRRGLGALYALHVGNTGGWIHQILLMVAGLAPSVLMAGGLVLWRGRRRRS